MIVRYTGDNAMGAGNQQERLSHTEAYWILQEVGERILRGHTPNIP